MSVNSVSDSTITYTRDASSDNSNPSVDTETFLKLLVAQLKYQDPLSPQDNTAFVTQLAQMSSLESMGNMNSTLTNSQAYDMIGKEIYAEVLDKDTGKTVGYNGIVDSVVIKSGTPYVVVVDPVVINDGTPSASTGSNAIAVSDIRQVFNPLTDGETTDESDTTESGSDSST